MDGVTWMGLGEGGLVLRLFISLSDYLCTTLNGERAVGFERMTDQLTWSKRCGWEIIANELGEDVTGKDIT